jgi:hypothetical protein
MKSNFEKRSKLEVYKELIPLMIYSVAYVLLQLREAAYIPVPHESQIVRGSSSALEKPPFQNYPESQLVQGSSSALERLLSELSRVSLVRGSSSALERLLSELSRVSLVGGSSSALDRPLLELSLFLTLVVTDRQLSVRSSTTISIDVTSCRSGAVQTSLSGAF